VQPATLGGRRIFFGLGLLLYPFSLEPFIAEDSLNVVLGPRAVGLFGGDYQSAAHFFSELP
jgi:hypothetical protein